jgi:hypothetical protein
MYLWRAVDHEGEILDVLVQRKRDRHTPPHQRRGSQRGGGSGSCRLPGGQAQARQEQLAVLRVSELV